MKRRVTYYLPEEIYEMLRRISYEEGEHMSTIIGRLIIKDYNRKYSDYMPKVLSIPVDWVKEVKN